MQSSITAASSTPLTTCSIESIVPSYPITSISRSLRDRMNASAAEPVSTPTRQRPPGPGVASRSNESIGPSRRDNSSSA
jgi:hypothetical protein